MSRGLTYADLTAAEQLQYTMMVSHIHAMSTGGDEGRDHGPAQPHTRDATAVPTPTPRASRLRHVWAMVQGVYASGKRWWPRSRPQPSAHTSMAQLAHFIRIQAARRGFETFERASFPDFPPGLDPFPPRVTGARDPAAYAYPDALRHILVTFREASPAQRLDLLVAYAERL